VAIEISIGDVPERVRDELAARAALQGKSMQEYLRAELERMVARPQTKVSPKQILENRNAGRR
jgi:plasmid stability protein